MGTHRDRVAIPLHACLGRWHATPPPWQTAPPSSEDRRRRGRVGGGVRWWRSSGGNCLALMRNCQAEVRSLGERVRKISPGLDGYFSFHHSVFLTFLSGTLSCLSLSLSDCLPFLLSFYLSLFLSPSLSLSFSPSFSVSFPPSLSPPLVLSHFLSLFSPPSPYLSQLLSLPNRLLMLSLFLNFSVPLSTRFWGRCLYSGSAALKNPHTPFPGMNHLYVSQRRAISA